MCLNLIAGLRVYTFLRGLKGLRVFSRGHLQGFTRFFAGLSVCACLRGYTGFARDLGCYPRRTPRIAKELPSDCGLERQEADLFA